MDEHKNIIKVRIDTYRIHILMYLLVIGFLIHVAWIEEGMVFYLSLGLLTFYASMMIIERVSLVGDHEIISEKPGLFYFYHVCQLIASVVLYFLGANNYSAVFGSVFIITYSMEILYHINFDENIKRFLFYLMVILPFMTVSCIWTMCKPGNTLEEHFQTIMASAMLCALIFFIGELLAKIWVYYEYKVLAELRGKEDLESENKNLTERQEKLNKINELLSMQKVQLQTANRRINNAHNEMVVQNEVASVISTSLDLELMVEEICQLLQHNMELDYVGILLEPETEVSPSEEGLTSRTISYRTTKGDEFALEIWKDIQQGVYDRLLDIQATLVENQGRKERTIRHLLSFVSVPLKQDNKRIGNLLIGKSEKNAFTHSSEFYETIGGQISVGITNAVLYQQMENMAIRDGLTGIYNRRYLTEMLQAKISEAKRKEAPVSLALFDIDKFKMINDTYGHLFGDEVIKYVAKLLDKTAVDNGGMAGRYGGEEFVIAFPGKGAKETFAIVEKFYQELKEKSLFCKESEVKVRVSTGIAAYPETCNNADDLLTRADWAMYHSKQNGRDQITIDNENISSKM